MGGSVRGHYAGKDSCWPEKCGISESRVCPAFGVRRQSPDFSGRRRRFGSLGRSKAVSLPIIGIATALQIFRPLRGLKLFLGLCTWGLLAALAAPQALCCRALRALSEPRRICRSFRSGRNAADKVLCTLRSSAIVLTDAEDIS